MEPAEGAGRKYSAMNILVIRLSSMGDVILATPLFSWLRERYPGSEVTFVTQPLYAPLLDNDPRLYRIFALQHSDRSLPEEVLTKKWDLVVDLQNNRQSQDLVSSLASARTIVRFNKRHWNRFALLAFRMNFFADPVGIAARYIACVPGGSSVVSVPPLRLYFPDEACAKARKTFDNRCNPSIAFFPFSAWKNKEWPQSGFINVGRHFLTKGWNVVILGGPEDRVRAEALREQIGQGCISLAGRLTLPECGALLSRFSLALGNDTGLTHLARAAGVKAGVLFGPTTRHFGFYPYGDPHYTVFETPLCCRPCHAHGGTICLRLTHRCLHSITPGTVIVGLEALLLR
jgi:ADP-heptose:LPS heptosyltransferase